MGWLKPAGAEFFISGVAALALNRLRDENLCGHPNACDQADRNIQIHGKPVSGVSATVSWRCVGGDFLQAGSQLSL